MTSYEISRKYNISEGLAQYWALKFNVRKRMQPDKRGRVMPRVFWDEMKLSQLDKWLRSRGGAQFKKKYNTILGRK